MWETSVQASITLTSLTDGIFPSTRTIKLHEDNDTIQIGRASKSHSKNLIAAADNCWVDSAVMSRDHARMKFDPEINTIFIEDSASMHGTRVNNHQIPRDDPIPLANDDIVSFGADVRRGLEVFPECRFRVNYEIEPYSPSRGVTYQLLSDDEDDDDSVIDISDDEDPVRGDYNISTSTPEHIVDAIPGTLDLTQQDDEHSDVDAAMDDSDKGAVVAKADEADQAQVESDTESVKVSEIYCVSIASTDYEPSEPSELPIGRATSADIMEEVTAAVEANIEVYASDHDAASIDHEMDLNESYGDEAWSVSDNDDDSNLGAEFLGYIDSDAGFVEDDIADTKYKTPKPTEPTILTPPHAEPMSDELTSTVLPDVEHDHRPIEDRYPTPVPQIPQHCSVEPTHLAPLDLDSPVDVRGPSIIEPKPSRLIARPTPPWRYQRVAEWSGKHEYFAAREENAAKISSIMNTPRRTATPPTDSTSGEKMRSTSFATLNNSAPCAKFTFGETNEQPTLTPFAQLLRDYESHYEVQSQSDACLAQEVQLVAPQPHRASLSINDIVDHPTSPLSSAAPQRLSLKRKAAAISTDDIPQAKVDVNPAITRSPAEIDALSTANVTYITKNSDVGAKTESADHHQQHEQEQQQSPKRQKRALKSFAFATVGGFVAGAGCLFAALVATAPDFTGVV